MVPPSDKKSHGRDLRSPVQDAEASENIIALKRAKIHWYDDIMVTYREEVHRPLAPQGRTRPLRVTGRPTSSEKACPPAFGTISEPSM